MADHPSEEPERKILIIDDDPSINELVCMALTNEGYYTYDALSGIRGYRLAKKEQPDIIILDVMMPEMDGFEVFRKLRLDPETKRIPVLFLSALTTEDAIQKGLYMGASGYITKPFDLTALIEKVKGILGQ
ncbi:MAG: response regulator [Actinobacteria bacterium]|nr:response regulator [Actinomycetota bacterium]